MKRVLTCSALVAAMLLTVTACKRADAPATPAAASADSTATAPAVASQQIDTVVGTGKEATAGATAAIKRATGVAEASLTQPGQPALDPKAFEGETISKDVVVNAEVRSPDGQTSQKTLTITIARVAGGGREGRPIITKITGL